MVLAWTQRRGLVLGVVFLAALTVGLSLSFAWEHRASRGRVLRGVFCAGRPVAGLDSKQLDVFLGRLDRKLKREQLLLRLAEQQRDVSVGQLGGGIDVAETRKRLLALGRAHGLGSEIGFWLARLFAARELLPQLAVDTKKSAQILGPWAKEVLVAPALPKIYYQQKLIVQHGAAGQIVDLKSFQVALRERLKSTLGRLSPESEESDATPPSEELIVASRSEPLLISEQEVQEQVRRAEALVAGPLHLESQDGEHQIRVRATTLGSLLGSYVDREKRRLVLTLSVAQLRPKMRSFLAQLERPAKSAEFNFGSASAPIITPSETGLSVDDAALAAALFEGAQSEERKVVVPLKELPPKLSTEVAESLGVKGIVSQFVTHHPCCQPRVHNIHTAADLLDGTILKPGQRFSLNDLLGPRSAAAGYKSAPTIVRGEMRKVYGGGISQLATTLFNAVLRGGYKIIQRQPHSVYFSRYPEGHEATVSFPLPDLIFENDTQAGMLIRTQYTGTFIKVLVYGENGGRVVSVHKSKRYDIKKPETEYEANEEMDPEKPKRLRAGQLGWTVLVSRKVKYPDGHVEEEKREVVYNSRPELIRVHPCTIPEGAEGHTGEDCPEPDEHEEVEEELSDGVYYETVPVYDEEEG